MSYILEALRKSERERQTGQVPSLPVLVADPPPRRRSWFAWLVVALLLFNAAGLTYLWLNGRDRNPVAPQSAGSAPVHPESARIEPGSSAATRDIAPPSAIIHENSPPQAIGDAARAVPKPPPQTTQRRETKPAEAVSPPSAKPKPISKPEIASVPPADRQPAKANASRITEGEGTPDGRHASELPVPAQNTPITTARLPAPAVSPAISGGIDEKADKSEEAGEGDIPLLRAMPVDFRDRIPPFKINIYAYTNAPADRFAIIDMKKYLVGDRIPGGALLLEIRSDSLVLELDGTKFRVPRP